MFVPEQTYMKAAHLSDNLPGDRKPERRPALRIDSKTSRDPALSTTSSCPLCPYNWTDNQVTFRPSRTNKSGIFFQDE